MKTYKLIKKYPSGPAVDTIICITDEWFDYNGLQHRPEDYPEYWELQPEKEYEILSIIYSNDKKAYLGSQGLYHYHNDLDEQRTGSDLTICLSRGWGIYSVKRLSDGEVFTIGDFCNGAPIDKIWFCDTGYLRFSASINGGYCLDLKSMEHQVFFSFTTEDGVVLRDKRDRVFGVLPKAQWQTNYYGGEGVPIERVLCSKTGELRATSWKWFSSKVTAENYRIHNRPVFSWGDLFRVMPSIGIGETPQYLKFKSIEEEK